MIRVLVTGAENIGVTGLATAVFRWGQAFDHEEMVYDYLMLKWLPKEEYRQQIESTGGILYNNPYMGVGHVKLRSMLWTLRTFKEQKDQILHINASWSYEAFPLVFLARLAGMKKIAVHSHSSYVDSNRTWIRRLKVAAHYFFRPYIVSRTGLKLACSREAAEWMFGKKVVQNQKWEKVYNSVDLDKYRFDPAARERHRKEFELKPDELLVGSIGRLSYAKNYEFLIEVMSELVKKDQTPSFCWLARVDFARCWRIKRTHRASEIMCFLLAPVRTQMNFSLQWTYLPCPPDLRGFLLS